jgi:hypothetical protein
MGVRGCGKQGRYEFVNAPAVAVVVSEAAARAPRSSPDLDRAIRGDEAVDFRFLCATSRETQNQCESVQSTGGFKEKRGVAGAPGPRVFQPPGWFHAF